MFKVNNTNTRETYSRLTRKAPERRNDVSDVVLVPLLLNLNIFHTFSLSNDDFENVFFSWERYD